MEACIKTVIRDLTGDVSLSLLFSSLGFSRSVVEGLEASSGADRNSNYRPDPDTLLFLHLLLSYQSSQTITRCAPAEAWCGFEYEWRLYCRVLEDMFYILQERWWRRTSIVQTLLHLWRRITGWVCSRALPLQPPLCVNTLKWKPALHYVSCWVLPEPRSRRSRDWIIKFHGQRGSQTRGKYESLI